MKEYFRYFRYLFLAFGLVLIVWIAALVIKANRKEVVYERTNTECVTQERVFDNADVLTDEEERSLRELIAEKEKQVGADIVLVTLNESLKEYARKYDEDCPYSEFTMIYADDFYDENKFGYDKPIGDGVLLLDNIYREDDGKVYTWMSTSGKVQSKYSSQMIDRILDIFYEKVDTDPYQAYTDFINKFYSDMTGEGDSLETLSEYEYNGVAFLSSIMIGGIYIAVNLTRRKGKKTVNQRSYINGGQPRIKRKEDRFIRKNVTSRVIETSSSSGGGRSGGGGSHVSRSGASHGGGGHSR